MPAEATVSAPVVGVAAAIGQLSATLWLMGILRMLLKTMNPMVRERSIIMSIIAAPRLPVLLVQVVALLWLMVFPIRVLERAAADPVIFVIQICIGTVRCVRLIVPLGRCRLLPAPLLDQLRLRSI